jgi:hypothetical protein
MAPLLVAASVILGAGVVALLRNEDTHVDSSASPPVPPAPSAVDSFRLPPDHPPIHTADSPHPSFAPATGDEAPALSWTAPSSWATIANPNAMRLASYGAAGGVEVSIARAGGTPEANIQRWLAQFDSAGKDTRSEKTVRGLHATIVEVGGTYEGMGGMGGQSHPGWALRGAIVETGGSSYFFKMLGPAAAVNAAHASFDGLLASLTPR